MSTAKVTVNGTTIVDMTDATATADKILAPYTAYGADGSLLVGTASGGLEYEEGTWTPSEDVAIAIITLTGTHTSAPFYYMIADTMGGVYLSANMCLYNAYYNYHQLFGCTMAKSGNDDYEYGVLTGGYRLAGGSVVSKLSIALTSPYTSSSDSTVNDSRYWATETTIKGYSNSDTRYWKAGRTYKWIAVWAPVS